ncbi:hypothetical protein HanPSC8_Chr09g0352391 [Helianthus annuus]|nr:hypothetical protein HanPSC8_Chr09g0352391 [Helianthus annuus]
MKNMFEFARRIQNIEAMKSMNDMLESAKQIQNIEGMKDTNDMFESNQFEYNRQPANRVSTRSTLPSSFFVISGNQSFD